MPVSCECHVLSGRGLCVGLITRPEESYHVCCVQLSVITKPRDSGPLGVVAPWGKNYGLTSSSPRCGPMAISCEQVINLRSRKSAELNLLSNCKPVKKDPAQWGKLARKGSSYMSQMLQCQRNEYRHLMTYQRLTVHDTDVVMLTHRIQPLNDLSAVRRASYRRCNVNIPNTAT